MNYNEDREQIALITWVRLMATKYPALDLVFHTPNGGYRDIRTAAKFKAMGLKPGVWDIFVPVPAPGLWVEMKAGKGRLTPSQVLFRAGLVDAGYTFFIAYSWPEAARAIGSHIGMDVLDLV